VYDVNATLEVREQIAAFPDKARPYLDELITFLELTPWNGRSASDKDPDANMRTQVFGPHGEGLAWYLIVEHSREVTVVRCGWTGHDHPLDSAGEDSPQRRASDEVMRASAAHRDPLQPDCV